DVSLRGVLMLALPALGVLASASVARGDTFALDLSKPGTYFDHAHSTGAWDAANGRIEAAFALGGTAGKEIDFGDGSDGVFSDGPAQTGITVGGSTITFNTDVKDTY